tara:strand:- start:20 stop:370 length:351 start_codon:yes stop_codon:yes gene_type:complete
MHVQLIRKQAELIREEEMVLTREADHLTLVLEVTLLFLEEENLRTETLLQLKDDQIIADKKGHTPLLRTRLQLVLTHHHLAQVDHLAEAMAEEGHQEDRVAEDLLAEEEDDKYVSI